MTKQVFFLKEKNQKGSGTLIYSVKDPVFSVDSFCIPEIKIHAPEDFLNVNKNFLETIYQIMDELRINYETKPNEYHKDLDIVKEHKKSLEFILENYDTEDKKSDITDAIEKYENIITEITQAIDTCHKNCNNLWQNQNIIKKILWGDDDEI